MATNQNQNPVPATSVYSVMIPWVETWVDESKIREELSECAWGEIEKVDMRLVTHGKREHLKVFIHFKTFTDADVMNHLDNSNEIKVFYNKTFFWKVRKSKYVHKEEPKKKFELV